MEWWQLLLTGLGIYIMGFATGRASGVVYTLGKMGGAKAPTSGQPDPEQMMAMLKGMQNQGVMRQ